MQLLLVRLGKAACMQVHGATGMQRSLMGNEITYSKP